MKFLLSILFILLFVSIFPKIALAQTNNSFITIINPQRIANYTKDYLTSFKTQYEEIKKRNLPATWPVTYDVLLKKDFVEELKKLDKDQELGLFLEVSPTLAKDAGVTYNQTSGWHHANALFLSGYSQNDRKKLIDVYFETFKKTFGYYPVSIGAWWVDSYSLSYMQDKYKITGVLGMSDQYDLDGYQLWGTWWSVPYYPSKINAAIPAQKDSNKINVVTFRWAPREPVNGYAYDEFYTPAMYSLQDYTTIGLSDSYYEKLLRTYAIQKPYNEFGLGIIGLEGDLSPEEYTTVFAGRLDIADAMQNDGVEILTMKDFSLWYMQTFKGVSPAHIIEEDDLLNRTQNKAIWVNTPQYRVGLTYNPTTQTTKIVDLREYYDNLEEPFLKSPNKHTVLSINLPFVIDSVIRPSSQVELNLGRLERVGKDKIVFEDKEILFHKNKIVTPEKTFDIKTTYEIPEKGITYKDYSITIPFTLKRRFPSLPGGFWSPIPKRYYISQTEYDALQVLKKLPKGTVLTYDKDCLKCSFNTPLKPAAAAGKKSYIKEYSKKPLLVDLSFLLSKTSKDAKNILKEKDVTYIYLSRYEDYIETLPYTGADMGLERVFENANAEIWKVK